MRYSIEPRERRYVKGYGFMSFARNFSDKYSKSLMDKGIDVSKTFAKTAGKKILSKSNWSSKSDSSKSNWRFNW